MSHEIDQALQDMVIPNDTVYTAYFMWTAEEDDPVVEPAVVSGRDFADGIWETHYCLKQFGQDDFDPNRYRIFALIEECDLTKHIADLDKANIDVVALRKQQPETASYSIYYTWTSPHAPQELQSTTLLASNLDHAFEKSAEAINQMRQHEPGRHRLVGIVELV